MKVQIIENESFIDKADFSNDVWLLNRTTEEELDERIVNISEITESLEPSYTKLPMLMTEIGNRYFTDDMIPEGFEYEVITDNRENFAIKSYVCDESAIKVISLTTDSSTD